MKTHNQTILSEFSAGHPCMSRFSHALFCQSLNMMQLRFWCRYGKKIDTLPGKGKFKQEEHDGPLMFT